jgi:hypothetical protein
MVYMAFLTMFLKIHAANSAAFAEDFSKIAQFANLRTDGKGDELLKAVKCWMESQENLLLVSFSLKTLQGLEE